MVQSLNRIGFLGGGKIAQAMAKGFISAGKTIFRFKALSIARAVREILFSFEFHTDFL